MLSMINRIILFSAIEIIEQQRQKEHRASDRASLLIHRLFGSFFRNFCSFLCNFVPPQTTSRKNHRHRRCNCFTINWMNIKLSASLQNNFYRLCVAGRTANIIPAEWSPRIECRGNLWNGQQHNFHYSIQFSFFDCFLPFAPKVEEITKLN